MIVDELVDLAAAMIDAFVSGGKIKPVMPQGRREEALFHPHPADGGPLAAWPVQRRAR